MGVSDLNKDKLTAVSSIAQVQFEVYLAMSVKVKLLMFGRLVSAIFDFFWVESLRVWEP